MTVELGGTNVLDPAFRCIRSSSNVAGMGMKDRLLDLEIWSLVVCEHQMSHDLKKWKTERK